MNTLAKHLAGQVNQVVEWLKARPGPHRLETISNSFQDTYADGIRLIFNPEMIRLLQTYTGVSWNAQLELLEYKNANAMKTPDELFRHIQNYSARPGGIPINFIKQNYTGSILYSDLLKTWEDEGKVLIMRFSQKATIPEPGAKPKKVVQAKGEDGSKTIMETGVNTWKAVMYDQGRADGLAPKGQVDESFRTMWASIETPESADLEKLLTELGHKVTPAEAAKKTANRAIKKDGRKKSRKQDVQKLTNVHMMALGVDLSQDYVPE